MSPIISQQYIGRAQHRTLPLSALSLYSMSMDEKNSRTHCIIWSRFILFILSFSLRLFVSVSFVLFSGALCIDINFQHASSFHIFIPFYFALLFQFLVFRFAIKSLLSRPKNINHFFSSFIHYIWDALH